MAGYTRQSSGDIATGNTIQASHFNNEFNTLEDAFDGTNGHSHDGTAGNSPKISLTASVSGLLPIANGGTNAATAADARTSLGLDTMAVQAASAVAITGGTINGASIGGTTPAAGTFTTLTANGNIVLGDASGDSVTINAATVSTPNGLNFDSNTFVINATNNRIGIGTASPSALVEAYKNSAGVASEIKATHADNTNTNSHATLIVRSGGASGGDAFLNVGVTGAQEWSMGVDNSDGDKFKLSRGGALGTNDAISVDTSNKVGIGTSSPTQILHINAASGTTLALIEVAANSIVGLDIKKTGVTTQHWRIADGITVNGSLEIYDVTDSRSVMVFDGNGNVGIDTSAPAAKLHVSENNDEVVRLESVGNPYLSFYTGATRVGYVGKVPSGITLGAENSNPIVLSTAGSVRVTVENGGSVVVGTSAANASAILDVQSTTKGFLPPRMTTAQKNAIATPPAGLVVYDTTLNKLCVYTTAWETITSS